MKLVRTAVAVGAVLASTSVFAADGGGAFEGAWAGLGMGFRGVTTKVTFNNPTTGDSGQLDSVGRDSVIGVIQGGYSWKVNWEDVGDFNLGPYLFYYLGNIDSDVRQVMGTSVDTRWKNQWGIGLQPGYYISKDTITYLKVGYNRVTLDVNAANATGQISPSETFSGPGIGLGMKHQLTNNFSIFVDTWEVFYGSKDFNVTGTSLELRPRMITGQFGFGYTFGDLF